MKDRVILDLCAGTGAWSQPYVEAGYDVRRVELKPGWDEDVRLFRRLDRPVHGILAAPPCTYFCRMRMCRGRPTEEQFRDGLSVVDACIRIVVAHRPKWWALENPQGYLDDWLGPPVLKFHPADYGDPWTKNTWLWGEFTKPTPVALRPLTEPWVNSRTGHPKGRKGLARNAEERAQTPPGFARAFMAANP